ncbi:MAG: hypothetical protein FWH36_02295 [Lentimicrobiaceae bacterium]|nr:hypothetical protein [Lentimicrobiaceae bacterium]
MSLKKSTRIGRFQIVSEMDERSKYFKTLTSAAKQLRKEQFTFGLPYIWDVITGKVYSY